MTLPKYPTTCLWQIAPGYLTPHQRGQVNITLHDRPAGKARPESKQIAGPNRHDDRSGIMHIIDDVAVIQVEGVLRKRPTVMQQMMGGGLTYAEITEAVLAAARDDSIRATVLYIDSPGGTVAGGSEAADAIYAHRKVKPIIAYGSDLMASAAYRLGSQATEIIADRDAQIGSIGTYAVVQDLSQMAEREGIKVHVIRAGRFKGAAQPGTEVTDEHLAEFQREVDQINDVFLAEIVRGRRDRGLNQRRVQEIADGRLHVGEHARELGLIDHVGSLSTALAAAGRARDDERRQEIAGLFKQHRLNTKNKRRGVAAQ